MVMFDSAAACALLSPSFLLLFHVLYIESWNKEGRCGIKGKASSLLLSIAHHFTTSPRPLMFVIARFSFLRFQVWSRLTRIDHVQRERESSRFVLSNVYLFDSSFYYRRLIDMSLDRIGAIKSLIKISQSSSFGTPVFRRITSLYHITESYAFI